VQAVRDETAKTATMLAIKNFRNLFNFVSFQIPPRVCASMTKVKLPKERSMQIPQEELEAVKKRLARAQGQLGGIQKMLEEGRECTDVLMQLSAAQSAISRAAFALITTGITHCATDEQGQEDLRKLEKAFLSLS